jgi:hypothetical protein
MSKFKSILEELAYLMLFCGCHEQVMSETDENVCVFPHCQNLLNNKFSSYVRFIGFTSPSSSDFPWYSWPLAITDSFITILIANINSQITH